MFEPRSTKKNFYRGLNRNFPLPLSSREGKSGSSGGTSPPDRTAWWMTISATCSSPLLDPSSNDILVFSIERDPSSRSLSLVRIRADRAKKKKKKIFRGSWKGKIEAFSPEKRWRMHRSADKSDDARPITGLPFTRRVASRPIRYDTKLENGRSSILLRFNDIVTFFLPRTRNFDRIPFRYTQHSYIHRMDRVGIANDRPTDSSLELARN